MRLINLIKGDIQFQFKYGYYFIYMIFTLLYISILHLLTPTVRDTTRVILIYTDPAAMGLFLMGAILLLEKSQRVVNSIAVSPVKASEYILSKIGSLGLIGTLVGTIIAVMTGSNKNVGVILGTFLGSVMFTMVGLIVASNIQSLNQFMVFTIPFELILFLPPMVYLFGYRQPFMLLHPGCIIIRFLMGDYGQLPPLILIMVAWIILLYSITYHMIKKMFQTMGGIKL